MTETDTRNGAIGGQLGAAAPRDTTFHGSDPDTVASDTICHATPTHCQARTRLYRDGRLVEQGFAIERISDHLTDPGTMIWLDLRNPDQEDLSVLQEEFGLHPVAIEDARVARERPKIDRYRTHLFLTAYSARLDMASGVVAPPERAPGHQRARRVHPAAGADHDPQGRRPGHRQGRRALGRESRPRRQRRRLPGIRPARLHRGRPLRRGPVPRRRRRGTGGRPVRPAVGQAPARAAALVRAAQVTRAPAPGRAAHARGAEHRDAPGPAARQRGPDALLPGRLRPRAARGRVDGVAARPRHDDPGDEPDDPGQPDERHHQEGHQLGGDHRGADVHHRVLRHERALPRVQRPRGLHRRLGDHGGLRRAAVLDVPPQRLAVIPAAGRAAAGTQAGSASPRPRGSRPRSASC
jgi:hypothetical protein